MILYKLSDINTLKQYLQILNSQVIILQYSSGHIA